MLCGGGGGYKQLGDSRSGSSGGLGPDICSTSLMQLASGTVLGAWTFVVASTPRSSSNLFLLGPLTALTHLSRPLQEKASANLMAYRFLRFKLVLDVARLRMLPWSFTSAIPGLDWFEHLALVRCEFVRICRDRCTPPSECDLERPSAGLRQVSTWLALT